MHTSRTKYIILVHLYLFFDTVSIEKINKKEEKRSPLDNRFTTALQLRPSEAVVQNLENGALANVSLMEGYLL